MGLDQLTSDLIKRALKALEKGKDLPAELFDLRLFSHCRPMSSPAQNMEVGDCLGSLVWKELGHRRESVGLSHPADPPLSQQTLVDAWKADFSHSDAELRAWSTLYHRFFSGLKRGDLIAKSFTEDKGKSAGEREFSRQVNRGCELLAATLQRVEIASIGTPNNLPAYPSNFIGKTQIDEVIRQLLEAGTRLLTLTGPGGCGKTRLAVEVAENVKSQFEGVWVVSLGKLQDEELVLQEIASALRITQKPNYSLRETVTERLGLQKLLLLLDNCEHLIRTCADVADGLLRGCPNLYILATSREELGIVGEKLWSVKFLSVPPPHQFEAGKTELVSALDDYDAARLFIARAKDKRGDFKPTKNNVYHIAQICSKLEGLPLLIELAAARIKTMSVKEIAEQLKDTFRLIADGSHTVPERHRSAMACFDWSYNLLPISEKALFRRLSVFAGGWRADAAEAVCAGEGLESQMVVDLLRHLVDASLVVVNVRDDKGTRYRLLETAREYAQEKMCNSGEEAIIRIHHRDWFLFFAERMEKELPGPDEKTRLDELEEEHENLRAALQWCEMEANGVEAQLRLAGTLRQFWERRGYIREGLSWLEKALSRSAVSPHSYPWRAKALKAAGSLAFDLANYAKAETWFEGAKSLYESTGDFQGRAHTLIDLGNVQHIFHGNDERAKQYYKEALDLLSRVEDKVEDKEAAATALQYLGNITYSAGEFLEAEPWLERALALAQETQSKSKIAWILRLLGAVKREQGDYTSALALQQESLESFRELENQLGIAYALLGLGRTEFYIGNCQLAEEHLKQSHSHFEQVEAQVGRTQALIGLGEVECYCHGNLSKAKELYENALTLCRQYSKENPFIEAWILENLSEVAYDQREYEEAEHLQRESLAIRCKRKNKSDLAYSLEGLASIAVERRQLVRAAQLLGAAEALREACGAPLPFIRRTRYQAAINQLRSQIDEAVFDAAWEEGKRMTSDQSTTYALEEYRLA